VVGTVHIIGLVHLVLMKGLDDSPSNWRALTPQRT